MAQPAQVLRPGAISTGKTPRHKEDVALVGAATCMNPHVIGALGWAAVIGVPPKGLDYIADGLPTVDGGVGARRGGNLMDEVQKFEEAEGAPGDEAALQDVVGSATQALYGPGGWRATPPRIRHHTSLGTRSESSL